MSPNRSKSGFKTAGKQVHSFLSAYTTTTKQLLEIFLCRSLSLCMFLGWNGEGFVVWFIRVQTRLYFILLSFFFKKNIVFFFSAALLCGLYFEKMRNEMWVWFFFWLRFSNWITVLLLVDFCLLVKSVRLFYVIINGGFYGLDEDGNGRNGDGFSSFLPLFFSKSVDLLLEKWNGLLWAVFIFLICSSFELLSLWRRPVEFWKEKKAIFWEIKKSIKLVWPYLLWGIKLQSFAFSSVEVIICFFFLFIFFIF